MDNTSDIVNFAKKQCRNFFEKNYSKEDISTYLTERLNFICKDFFSKDKDFFGKDNYLKIFSNFRKKDNIVEPGNLLPDIYTIWSQFDYVRMSKKRSVIDDHILSYVIPNDDIEFDTIEDYLERDFPYLNPNEKILNDIFEFILNKSSNLLLLKTINDRQKSDDLKKLCKFVFYGPPGVGKTTIINYLFSINSERLIREKVIWIRVDLNKSEGAELDLRNRLNAKFVRIFSKFYLFEYTEFDKSFLTKLNKDILEFLSKRYSESYRGVFSRHVTKFINLLQKLKDSDINTIDYFLDKDFHNIDYFNDIFDYFVSYIQNNYSYAFIFIFDGLDSVTIDFTQFDIFQNWLRQLNNISDNENKPYKAVYIYTMRDYSLIDFHKQTFSIKRTEKLKNLISFKEMPVKQVGMTEIIDSKMKLVKKYIGISDGETIDNIRNNLLNLLYMSFFDKSPEEVINVSFSDIDSFLKMTFGSNYRRLMRFFQQLLLVISSILNEKANLLITANFNEMSFLKEFEGKEYKISRMFLFGDQGDKPYLNKIQYRSGELVFSSTKTDIIPNIFNFFDKLPDALVPFIPKNLIKIRIIQYLLKNRKVCSIVELMDWLFELYYKDSDSDDKKKELVFNQLRHETREMFHTGVLYPQIDETSLYLIETQKGNYNISLLPLGELMIDKILKKSIFYEIVVDDTPLSQFFLRNINYEMMPLNRFDKRCDLGQYLMIKTKNIILFIEYLNKIENEEKAIFNINLNIRDEQFEKEYRIFSRDIRNEINNSIEKYLSGFFDKLSKEEKENYIAKWERFFNDF